MLETFKMDSLGTSEGYSTVLLTANKMENCVVLICCSHSHFMFTSDFKSGDEDPGTISQYYREEALVWF